MADLKYVKYTNCELKKQVQLYSQIKFVFIYVLDYCV